jgi:hypothetical protein
LRIEEEVAVGVIVAKFINRRAEQAVRSGARIQGRHHVRIHDDRGRLVHEFKSKNVVTTAGVDYLIGAAFVGSPSPITSWFVGLIPDDRHVNDAAISNGSTTLTSATATFLTGDVGRYVTVIGAGVSNGNLSAKIASRTSNTVVDLDVAASTTVTGAIASIGPKFDVADTMGSHAGWAEISSAAITNSTRPAWTPGAVSSGSVDDSGSPAVYTMDPALVLTGYLHGLFLCDDDTLGGTTGTLYSTAEFNGGAKPVAASYVVSDVYTVSAIAG